MRPFTRGPFGALPKLPRLQHDDSRMDRAEVFVSSQPFGPVTTYVRELGEGPPLLLVHGLMTTGYSFRYVVGELAKRFRVIVPDLPGAGQTQSRPGQRYTAASLARWIQEFVAVRDIRGCQAVGNSLGGYLCMRAALDEPRLFSRLVNIHSPAIPEFRYHALRLALAMPFTERALRGVIAASPKRWVHRNVHYYDETLKSQQEAVEYGRPLSTADGRHNFVSYLRDAVSAKGFAEFRDRLTDETFPIPLMLLYAARDPMVHPRHGDALRRMVTSAEFHCIDNTSHFMHVDTPSVVLTHLSRFLGPVTET